MLQPLVKEADGLLSFQAKLPSGEPQEKGWLASYSLTTQPRISFSEHTVTFQTLLDLLAWQEEETS